MIKEIEKKNSMFNIYFLLARFQHAKGWISEIILITDEKSIISLMI